MTITQHISIDLQQPGNAPMIHAVQGDEYTRAVEIDLYSGGMAWNPPSGCEVVIRYGKPDGNGGIYGTLPDGTTAWSIDGNTVSVVLAPQMLTVPGIVNAQAQIIINAKEIISTFHFNVNVEEDPSKGAVKSENYVNWKTYYIPQTAGAIVGQYLQISKVDADGKVVGVKPVDDPAKGAKDYANAAYDKSNEALSTAETAGQLADIAIGKSDNALNGLSYMSQDIQRIEDEQQDVKDSISGKLPAPITAKVGQTIVVKSIAENGAVTAVEAVDAPSGGGLTKVSQLENDSDYAPRSELPKTLYVEYWDGELNKSLAEIGEAYKAGSVVFGAFALSDDAQFTAIMTYYVEEDGLIGALFNGWAADSVKRQVILQISDDGSGVSVDVNDVATFVAITDMPSALPNPHTLTINSTVYDGSTAVDMTAIINAMIDAKVATIPNASGVSF